LGSCPLYLRVQDVVILISEKDVWDGAYLAKMVNDYQISALFNSSITDLS